MKKTKEEITRNLFERLWEQYLSRVSYARVYVDLVEKNGGKVVNDHIAFRTFNTHTGEQPAGISAIRHIISSLGYQPALKYHFEKKKLNAVHYEHSDPLFPKIFVSQLEIGLLPEWAQQIINNTVKDTPYLLSDHSIELLNILKEKGALPVEAADYLVKDLFQYFKRPWKIPFKNDVLKLNDVSQYAAWTLLHGNAVNHYTAFINYQDVAAWPDLETTCRALADAGVPMKDKIEGKKGSKLQQSSTQAVKEEVDVRGENEVEKMTWTYAYYELAERNFVETEGEKKLFSGFLGEQATHLFDMTQTRDN
ncbi:MAG: DUF1338 domain-containing protein [Draconibacterium sp.]|nr:MAG: DUF1338 domain-containing protein [Draconibacterium sp.]